METKTNGTEIYDEPAAELPALPDMSTVAALLEFSAALSAEIYRMDVTGTSPAMLILAPLVGELTLSGETITQKRLQERTGLPKSTLSRAISGLLSAGWILETVDPEDRRRRILQPSTRSIELSVKVLSLTEEVLTRRFGTDVLYELRERAIRQGAKKIG